MTQQAFVAQNGILFSSSSTLTASNNLPFSFTTQGGTVNIDNWGYPSNAMRISNATDGESLILQANGDDAQAKLRWHATSTGSYRSIYSEVRAESDGIQIVNSDWTDSPSYDYRWKFGLNGDLVLPTGKTIRDTDGVDLLGSATTNEIKNTSPGGSTYSVSVGTDGVVTMTTQRGNIEFGALPEPGGPSHFHIMKASTSTDVDLYFGDDYNYVLQRGNSNSELAGHSNDYGVEIGTRDLSTGTSTQHVWRFDTDGTLTVPGPILGGSGALDLGVDGSVVLSGTPGQGAVIQTAVSDNSSTSTWTFDNSGTLTFPQGGYIGSANVKGNGTMLTGGSGNLTSLTSFYSTGSMYSSCVTANPDGTLNITTYGDGTGQQGQWTFAGANLTFPDSTTQTTAYKHIRVQGRLAGSQSIPNSIDTQLSFVADIDPNSLFNVNSIVIGSTGTYEVCLSVLWATNDTNTDDGQINVQIHRNGSEQVFIAQHQINVHQPMTMGGSVLLNCDVFDTITVTAYTSGTNGQTVSGGNGTVLSVKSI
jgi:hypothetical protein